MAKDRDNPFHLPISLTGIGEPDLIPRALGMAGFGIIIIAIVAIAAKVMGWSTVSLWTLASDTAFLLVRIPRGFQTFVSDLQASGWGIPLLLAGLFILIYLMNSHLTTAAEFMARRLSLGDRFPLSGQGARKAGLTLTFLLVGSIVGGGIVWFGLLLPSDSIILKIIRLISIAFLVQIACMLIGGAMACSQAEGRRGTEALYRMILLAWLEKGHFLRAAVYTLPRWLSITFLSWCSTFAAISLPFLITEYILPLWLSFLRPVDSTALHIGRIIVLIIVGLFLLVLWGTLLKTNPQPLLRLIFIVGLIATAWCFFILPFFFADQLVHLDSSVFWFSEAWHYLNGHPVKQLSWQLGICLFFVGVIVALNTATMLGIWLFLYPLASGVCAFFLLRYGAEGTGYRSLTTTQSSSQSKISVPGTFMFTSGGASALASLSPPRGWLALTWVGIRPELFIMGMAMLFAGWFFWGVIGTIIMSTLVLPILCRKIAISLEKNQSKKPCIASHLLPLRTVVVWLLFLTDTIFIVVGVSLGGSLGLIPLVGPILWGLFYLFMLLGANSIVVNIIRWIPGSMILPAIVANDAGPSDRASDILKRTDHYVGATPWTFVGAIAAGLPLALAPALVVVVILIVLGLLYTPFSDQQWLLALDYILGFTQYKDTLVWPLLGIWCVLGLVFLGISVALTDAYLIIKQSLKTQQP